LGRPVWQEKTKRSELGIKAVTGSRGKGIGAMGLVGKKKKNFNYRRFRITTNHSRKGGRVF